jgi:hypothetical protein
MDTKFSDGSTSAYAELPVPAAWLRWTRGNAQLSPLIKTDPAQYFGGWRAFVTNKDGEALPALPLPIVERMSEDGKHAYKVYATNILSFLPLQHRTRFEMRTKVKDEETGREYEKTVAISKNKLPGYAPSRQIFGLVFDETKGMYSPAVLTVNKWSAFISFERAGQKWNKVAPKADQALVRRYGSIGVTKNGITAPNFEIFGQSRSTPIEAIEISKPYYVQITNEIDELYEASKAWKNCERWNGEGEVQETTEASPMTLFLEAALALGLNDTEVAQIVKENNGDYTKALASIQADPAEVITEDDPF